MSDLVRRLRLHDDSRLYEEAEDLIAEAADEITRLREELEVERVRLAACGVVAMANTPESAARHRDMLPEYRSASCNAVARAVDEQMRLRAEVEALRAAAERSSAILMQIQAAAVDNNDLRVYELIRGAIAAIDAACAARKT